jgi:hypothetical protein
MLASGVPVGSNPVKVAPLMSTHSLRTKSSAVSVSDSPALAGPDSVAIFPSGIPVEKEKVLADARGDSNSRADKLKQMARIEAGLSSGIR